MKALGSVALLTAALVLAGCGGGGDDDDSETLVVTDGKVTVDADEYSFAPDRIETTAGSLEVTLVQKGDEEHTIVIDGVDDFKLTVDGDPTETGTAELEPGEYAYYCDIAGHRGQGMHGTLVVE